MTTDLTMPFGPLPMARGPVPGARAATEAPAVRTLIDDFLAAQGQMTAVENFSQRHDDGVPAQARYYRDLIPATPPGPGQQYAFEVDLDACTGCKACVTGCASMNGLDDGEVWRSVGLITGTDAAGASVQQAVTTACHHCVDPGCMQGCPVEAYEKDPVTGIVRHLDDQCIGCGYCIFTCAYEVPQYSADRGIVRKCDMCTDRLEVGEAPACVQSCPTQAITIRLVDVADVVASAGTPWKVPSPSTALTTPSTSYVGDRDLGDAEAVDLFDLRPQHAHPPLATMLVLTQVAVGIVIVELLLRVFGGGPLATAAATPGAVTTIVVAIIALAASVLHLGRPRYAYRAVLGLRTSWLSREIVVFGLFAPLAATSAAVRLGGLGGQGLHTTMAIATGTVGLAGVACSAMLYIVTGRRWWHAARTVPVFLLTTATGGTAAVLVLLTVTAAVTGVADLTGVHGRLTLLLVGLTAAGLAVDLAVLRHLRRSPVQELPRTARMLVGPLRLAFTWRLAAAVLGGVMLPLWATALVGGTISDPVAGSVVGALGLLAVLAGEFLGRTLFFRALSSRRMPGMTP